MVTKITFDVLAAYLRCKYKGYLRLAGRTGIKSDYESTFVELSKKLRAKAIEKVRSHFHQHIPNGIVLTRSTLSEGAPFALDVELQHEQFSVRCDGLKRVAGRSELGDFHYVPVLFCEHRRIEKMHRTLLEVLGFLLSRIQGKVPSNGVIFYGSECRTTVVRFTAGLQAAQDVLEQIARMHADESTPPLLLNDHCQACEFRQECRAQAVKDDSLSLLRGLGEKEIKAYGRNGLFTLTQLAHTFRPRRNSNRSDRGSNRRYHALQAMAIRDKTVYVLGTPKIPFNTVRIYLDMEGDPDEGFVYLIGMMVCDGQSDKRFSFWADSKDQELYIFEQFLYVVTGYDTPSIFCYGGYERAFIKRMRQHARRKKPVDKVLTSLTNTLSIIYAHCYFPTYSNGLKEVAGFLGFSWSGSAVSGLQSIAWRMRWEKTHDECWKARLIEYNLDDCAALAKVTDFLHAACAGTSTLSGNRSDHVNDPPQVVQVQELDKFAYSQKWGPANFFHSDLEFVNKCAYFDYQRQRVFVRTSRTLKKHRRVPGLHRNRKIRPSRNFEITASKCPSCGHTNVVKIPTRERINVAKTRVKRTFDLVITPSGMQRRVLEFRAATYRCTLCGNCFVPERYQRAAKHFHGLMSWAIYQHVAHRISNRTLQELFREFFGLAIANPEIHEFKSIMARHYRATYRNLLAKMVSGPLLHVDETEVKLRTGKGYVWVFTSLEEAIYIYRPTREGKFLQDMLRDFKGVLVSDFYAAYDSLGCPQQKCLIHLIRDMNQELLNNPYDLEFQSVTQPFSSLLRSIVATVDEHGLKRRHLKRHTTEVAEFFRTLSNQSFRSEAAQSLQERMVKNKNKLFTFIQHDGVPWNNNNAENAIKRFAYYRENTVGVMKEKGLNDYLLLLSIYQTCRFKGISFFKFLLSRVLDIDEFSEGKRIRKRRRDVELYPSGFIPAHLVRFQQLKTKAPQVTPAG
jgi:predicted RecB family nuclease